MPPRRRKGVRGASATSAAASKKMINAAESKKNTKPLSLAMSSDKIYCYYYCDLRNNGRYSWGFMLLK